MRNPPSKLFLIVVSLVLLFGIVSCKAWMSLSGQKKISRTQITVAPSITMPTLQEFQATIAKVQPSVVKVESLGCGGTVDGSGFIVAPGLVATNAHVVAGTHNSHIIDDSGEHVASPVIINSEADLAILKVDGLADTPLTDISISSTPTGEQGVILGYPGGKAFAGKPAVITGTTTAYHDIYGNNTPPRNVYTIDGDIIPGNSGGPLVGSSGNVMGVVFAKSTDSGSAAGYAITPRNLRSIIQKSKKVVGVASTGACASEQFNQLTAPPAEPVDPIPLN